MIEPNVTFGIYNTGNDGFVHCLIDYIETFDGEIIKNPEPEWLLWDSNPHEDKYPLKVTLKEGWVTEYGENKFTALLGAWEGLTRFYRKVGGYVYLETATEGGIVTLEKYLDYNNSQKIKNISARNYMEFQHICQELTTNNDKFDVGLVYLE